MKISALLGLIPIAASIDQSRLSEIVSFTAKSVNNLPTLNPEDKPGTANFKNYVTNILQTEFILYITVNNLTRTNKNEAAYLTNQINRKELRIAAELALTTTNFEVENK